MKKIICTLLFVLCPFAVSANGRFVGAYLARSNITVPVTGLEFGQSKLYSNEWGLALSLGRNYNEFFVMEVDANIQSIDIEANGESNSLFNISAIFGGRAQIEIKGSDIHEKISTWKFRPYIGAGIGVSLWVNDTSYAYTTYPSAATINSSDLGVKFGLAYQIKFGMAIPFGEKFDLDLGIRYQALGRPNNVGTGFNISGNITNTEYRIGVLYRY